MSTSSIIISILFILCLTAPVVTRSLGLLAEGDKPSRKLLIPLMFGATQGLAAGIGYGLGRLISHFFASTATYLVFALMLVVAVKMFVDSIRMLKGKMLFTVSSDFEVFGLAITSAMNTLLMSLACFHFMPLGVWFFLAVVGAGFLWSFLIVRVDFTPNVIKKASFYEFSSAVFMVIIAVLYLSTDLMQ